MNNNIIYKFIPYVIIIFLLLIIFNNRSSDYKDDSIHVNKQEIIKKGVTDSIISISDTIVNPKPIIIKDTVYEKNPINQELLYKYKKAINEIDKIKLYKDAITIKNYKEVFEDTIQKTVVYSQIQGKLLKQYTQTTIKPIEYKYKETIITKTITKYDNDRFFIGASIYVPLDVNENINYTADIAYKFKNGNILEIGAGYNVIKAGYKINLW